MKVFALLGLATLACADEDRVVPRRRLAVQKCSFAALRAGAHNPNCMGKFSWEMDAATGDSKNIALDVHDYNCCLDKHPGWVTSGKYQQTCSTVTSKFCKDVKADDAACLAGAAAKPIKTNFYSFGYTTTACTNYADDCRASLQCNTAGGYSGTPDLACSTGYNGQFAVRGCGRGDVGQLGVDLTSKVFIVAPHTAPTSVGNMKNSFAECKNLAWGHGTNAFYAGNGGCDKDNTCHVPDTCGVIPTWDGVLEASESEDTWVRPFIFKSKQNENCIDLGYNQLPTAASPKKDCPGNTKSVTDTSDYGGFDLYGERLSCWRNAGGGIQAKKNQDMKQFDLTYKVMKSPVNAGIGVTLFEFEKNIFNFQGLWNGGADGIGYGVCNGVDGAKLGGCTAELAALMCEAYNKELYQKNGAATNINDFCVGFSLQESSVSSIGNPATKKNTPYVYKHPHDMLVGFFSKNPGDASWNKFINFNGGYFKYIPITNCLVTSTVNCGKCSICKTGFSVTSEGQCTAACPAFQYSLNGVCTYRTAHCIAGSADGTTCTKCHTGFGVSIDKTKCEESGCTTPAKLESPKKDVLVGKVQGSSAACSVSTNIVPSGSCGVDCPAGTYSSDSKQTHTYSCSPAKKLAVPTIVCSKCGVAKCSSCASNPLCDGCEDGYTLAADKKSCVAKACPTPAATGVSEAAGACKTCPKGTAGSVTWNAGTNDWDTSACVACEVSNCADCKGKKEECIACASGYAVKDATKKICIQIPDCPYGHKGTTTWSIAKQEADISKCVKDATKCEDLSQKEGTCTDCKDGFAGSVDWDYSTQKWIKTQCHAVPCPKDTETSPGCNKCPDFQTGKPVWDDLFNQWVGCVANDFGFSGPSASWSGSVSADINEMYVIETKTAEALHVANSQYDAIKEEWVCDEGYGGEGCRQRLCPETLSFVSGTDGFTPSKSAGVTFQTDAAKGTSSTFNNQHSYRECGGRGTCDFETGICQCFPGFTGVGCRRTTCPNSCSGHGVCMNDDISNYHAAGKNNLPAGDVDINSWGNLWATKKFQRCKCDGGWSGNDCSLRQCPRGDDPETQCADDLGNDVQYIECTKLVSNKEHFFKLRFTDLLGNRYDTRAIVIRPFEVAPTAANKDIEGLKYTKAASHSIQTALESLPNFAIPKVEVTTDIAAPAFPCTSKTTCTGKKKAKTCTTATTCDYTQKFALKFELKFTDARNSGQQALLELESDMQCGSGVQPKFANAATFDPTCTISRKKATIGLRENIECSNRGLCNRKTAECNCFDGYTGLSCDTVAQTY